MAGATSTRRGSALLFVLAPSTPKLTSLCALLNAQGMCGLLAVLASQENAETCSAAAQFSGELLAALDRPLSMAHSPQTLAVRCPGNSPCPHLRLNVLTALMPLQVAARQTPPVQPLKWIYPMLQPQACCTALLCVIRSTAENASEYVRPPFAPPHQDHVSTHARSLSLPLSAQSGSRGSACLSFFLLASVQLEYIAATGAIGSLTRVLESFSGKENRTLQGAALTLLLDIVSQSIAGTELARAGGGAVRGMCVAMAKGAEQSAAE